MIEHLKAENKKLENLNKKLRLEEEKKEKKEKQLFSKEIEKKVYEILEPVFTRGQIRKLLHPNSKKVIWSREDVASAIALRSVSPKGYRFLRKRNHPLPALSTLRKWALKANIQEGIVDPILQSMKSKATSMTESQRLCALSFDEIYISQQIEIERKEEKRIGPHKTAQVGMVRGLFSKWKQPVYYDFDKPLTKEVLLDVINKLYDSGYTVVTVTTDLGPTNTGVWSSMNIGVKDGQNCYFVHPKDPSLKIFIFADPPHLLKLIRNNYVDSGFLINNVFIGKHYIEKLLILAKKKDYSIVHKLERLHIDVKGPERQKVSTAAQLFSNHSANAINYCGQQGFFDCYIPGDTCSYENFEECADLFHTVNNWFDVMNSKKKYDSNDLKCAYGIHLDQQNEALDKMSNLMKNLRVGSHKTMLPFQKGVILSINSLKQLLPYLKEKYRTERFPITYVFTNRINQDVLENFFSFIRGMGSAHSKPSALQFRYRLRWYVLGRHCADMLTDKKNTEDDEDESLIDSVDFERHTSTTNAVMGEILDPLYDEEQDDVQGSVDFNENDYDVNHDADLNEIGIEN